MDTYPQVDYKLFLKNVQTGDILLTRANNNYLSCAQEYFLHAPATHASIIVKISEDEIYMYEGATFRGAQFRSLFDYVENSNVGGLFWRQTYENEKNIMNQILSYVHTSYDWSFIKYVFYEALGISFLYYLFISYEKLIKLFKSGMQFYEREDYNCSNLIARIFENLDIIKPKLVNHAIFPSHFLNDAILQPKKLSLPIKVINMYN